MAKKPQIDEQVQKTIKIDPNLWDEIDAELRERGGISFTAFALQAFANELRRERQRRVEESRASYTPRRTGTD